MRMSVGVGYRLSSARTLDVHVGGAESNVCAALSGLDRRCGWWSRLPNDPLGQLVLRRVRELGVDVTQVLLAPDGRLGTYYVEFATPPLPARVTYDRAGSAFSRLEPEQIAWDYLLDTRILHLTGITPALGEGARIAVEQAVGMAKERGVLVSLDVNYRERLWSPSEAARVLKLIIRDVDLLICGRKDACRLFGVCGEAHELLGGLEQLSGARYLVMTMGGGGAIATDSTRGTTYSRQAFPVTVVDRIGAGDAFAAGVIDGILQGSLETGLTTGTALAAVALSQHGDVVNVGRDELVGVVGGSSAELLR